MPVSRALCGDRVRGVAGCPRSNGVLRTTLGVGAGEKPFPIKGNEIQKIIFTPPVRLIVTKFQNPCVRNTRQRWLLSSPG